MLPLGLLNLAQGHPMLVELKDGTTLNGHLVNCDTYMNLTLKEVVQTSAEGDRFFRLSEAYVRGNNIKYLRLEDEIVEAVKEQQQQQQQHNKGGRGGSRIGNPAITQSRGLDGAVAWFTVTRFEAPPLKRNGERRGKLPRSFPAWESKSSPELYDMLRSYAEDGKKAMTVALVDYLVRNRGEKPNSRLYSSLILCNVDIDNGSALTVAQLLAEVEDEGLPMDSGMCHDALKVLSVHVDHILRADILEHMRKSWLTLSTEGQYYVAAGLLREGCLEDALQMLSRFRHGAERLPTWLADLTTYTLLDAGEHGGALDAIIDRNATGETIDSAQLAYEALDSASKVHHYAGTLHAWNTQVKPGHTNPSTGTYLQVLATAAKHGDTDLAVQVFRCLGQQAIVFSEREYSLLCQAYLSSQPPDLFGALSTACIMAENNIVATQVFTRPFLIFLRHEPLHTTEKAFEHIQELHRGDRSVPLALINVILESYALGHHVNHAMAVYQSMHQFERYGPPGQPRTPFADAQTFEILYFLARFAARDAHDMMALLREEQRTLGINTTESMVDKLIVACVKCSDPVILKEVLDEARELNMEPKMGTLKRTVEALASVRDEFCWEVIRRYSKGEDMEKSWTEEVRTVWDIDPSST
ncbi:hypothetical protein CAC42_3336 [Sphaceloma murrayae]|uniref:Sm domain-containing protein n=1 Tax=Sphaceloma murrayae TaxID=2082308 RepID=A0A2K1R122_9PEZI|nr:hypothetical protein CAC42_3336 [Sphaceloma murrayae]